MINRKQRGAIEPIVFGLFAVLVFLGLSALLVQKVFLSDSSFQVLLNGHRLMVKAVYDDFPHATDFSTLDNAMANQGRYPPDNWNRGGSTIVNNVNGAVNFDGSTCNGIADACFSGSQANLSASLCKKFANAEFVRANTIIVGTTTVKANATAVVNPATINAACNNATNTVAVQYSKF
ncbi:hypothetical protein AB835_08110 [Candidatus Endobugula sertula]|uniref:Type 4 secretion system PilS N-terminal domain-containing protein n=1 Tax=Candidatus Endobugula sertula TaxID=62101 RepID=A0A1D2QPR2_9GAMM|nr:hypothetical protein AB835_08110 [Candidatus Endobugula sertula]